MPDEPTIVAEPVVEDAGFDLGNLAHAFDAAFPATAPKPGAETVVEPVPPAAEPAPAPPTPAPAAATAPAPAATTDDGLPPDDVFGDKPIVPPVAAKPEPQVEVPANIKDPKAIENWKQLRTGYDDRGKKLETADATIAELRQKLENPATDEGLVARLAEQEAINKHLTERQATFDLQSSDVFQQQFIQPRQKKVGEALEIAKEAGVEASDIERLIGLPPKAQKEALDEVLRGIDSPTLQNELTGAIKDIRTIDRGAASVLADSKGNLEKLRQHAKAQEYTQLQEHTKFIDKAVNEMADYLGNLTDKDGNYKGCAYFRKLENNPEWTKKVDGYVQRAKETATNSKDERQLLSKLLMGEAMPDIYDDLVRTRKQNKELKTQLAEFKSADPSLNGNRGGDSGDPPIDKGLSFSEAAARGSGLP